MKQNLLFNQLTAMPKRLAMVLTVLFTLGVGSMLGETIFNITNYSSIPSGWTNSGVSTGSYFKFDSDGCYLITSTYDPHTDLTLTYKVATYESGTNHPLTIQLLDENGNVKQTHTTGTPTSSTYITGTWSIGTVNYKFKIKFYLAETGKGVRLQVPKLVGDPATSTEPYTVTLDAGSGTCDDESLTETSGGAGVTLPTANPPATCATNGWKFAGWWTGSVAETTTSPGELLAAGSNYKPTTNCTLYAVYSHTEAGGGGSGFYLSVTQDATTYYIGEKGSGSFLSAVTDVNSAATFNIENNQYLYYGNKTYVSSTANSTSLTIATTTPTVTWAITDEGETITFKSNGTGGRYLAFNYNNGSPRFSSYGSTYTYKLTKHTTSTTTYNSNPVCGSTEPTHYLLRK